MKLPNWFKIGWWILLLIISGYTLSKRYDAISNGQSVTADMFIFALFVALMLVPIFAEIEFFGVKLKQEFDELKRQVEFKIGDIKSEIISRQSQAVTTNINSFGIPPGDNELPHIENEIDKFINETAANKSSQSLPEVNDFVVEDVVVEMFKVRFQLETILRRLYVMKLYQNDVDINKHEPLARITNELTKAKIINPQFSHIIREILAVCSYAVHGEVISDAQAQFVKKNSKKVLEYLEWNLD